MRFTKMHGIGNCYIFVNCFSERVRDASELARRISDRNTGVGSDGLVLICPSDTADARMEMYNLDGSRGQMCGNAIRCVGKYLHDYGIARKHSLRIDTDAGIKTLELAIDKGRVSAARVDMGKPGLRPEDLPTTLKPEQMIDYQVDVIGGTGSMTCVSMGNPHAVIYGVDPEKLTPQLLKEEGLRFEFSPLFPERVNVHFVRVDAPDEATMLTWERGSGATAACGTGASAVCVAGVLTGRSDRKITAHLPGGDLQLEWDAASEHVFMTGPAAEIFSGDWPEDA